MKPPAPTPATARCAALRLAAVAAALLFLAGALLPGALASGSKDDGPLLAGKAALEDGLYDLAREHLENALRKEKDPAERDRITLLLVEALAGLGQHTEAEKHLQSLAASVQGGPLEAARRYWLARLDYLQGRHDPALNRLREIPAAFPGHELLPRARLLEGRCLLAMGKIEEAMTAFESLQEHGAPTPEAAEGLLDGAAALLREQRWTEAETRLRALAGGKPDQPTTQRARLWLGQLLIDEQAWSEAREVLATLADDDVVEPTVKATALIALSEVEEAGTNLTAALDLLAAGLQLATDPQERTQAQLAQGRLMIQTGQKEQGLALLRTAVGGQRSEEEAGTVQLHFATVLFKQQLWEQALVEFQRYLEAFSDRKEAQSALDGRAKCLWELGRYGEAAKAFERAALAAQDPSAKVALLYRAADSQFADGQYQPAMDIYTQVLHMSPDKTWKDSARYQIALCLIRKEAFDEAEPILRELAESAGEPDLAEASAMRLARLREEQRRWEDAVVAYDAVMARFPEGRRFPEALFRRGVSRYRLGQFAEAHADFEQLMARFPDQEPAEQAFYMRGFTRYMMGETEEAVRIAGEFLQRFPESRWAPRVGIWLGEYYYNLGRYEEAEAQYLQLATAFPRHPQTARALLEAARCAYARKEYLKAIDHVKLLAQGFPTSTTMPEARFLHGDALSELGDFSSAIVAFEEILKQWPDSYLAPAAQGRIGDCHFTLGSPAAPDRFVRAYNHYKAVADSPGVTPDLRLQALFKMARCREKMNEPKEAFEGYMKVVDQTREAWNQGTPAGTVWFTRAAFAAASLMEAEARWREAIQIYRRVVDAAIPAAEEAERRIRKIRIEQLILL